MSENNDLGIYEGCYVVLRNGTMEGPVTMDNITTTAYIWDGPVTGRSWTDNGREWNAGETQYDIIRVLTPAETDVHTDPHPSKKQAKATIPPHVLTAAMDAGIKAKPVYEQFVNAVLEAGFAAMGDRIMPVVAQEEVDVEALANVIAVALSDTGRTIDQRIAENQAKILRAADAVTKYFTDKQIPKNESSERIQDSEKFKGGPSDFYIAPDLIAIALDEAERKSQHSGISTRSFQIKAINDLIRSESSKYGPRAEPEYASVRQAMEQEWESLKAARAIPSVQTIEEAIRAAVREWRETNLDMGMVPPISMIAKKVHAVLSGDIELDESLRDTHALHRRICDKLKAFETRSPCMNLGAWAGAFQNLFRNAGWMPKDEMDAENTKLRTALTRIEKWQGEFPPSGRSYEDGTAMSYSAAFGSNGERDYMRAVAREALES